MKHPSINSRATTGSNFMIKEEEKALGILEHDTVEWRPKNIPDSDGQLILIVMTKKGADWER